MNRIPKVKSSTDLTTLAKRIVKDTTLCHYQTPTLSNNQCLEFELLFAKLFHKINGLFKRKYIKNAFIL